MWVASLHKKNNTEIPQGSIWREIRKKDPENG